MTRELDFERPVLEIERQISDLRRSADVARAQGRSGEEPAAALEQLIAELQDKAIALKAQIFNSLSRWQVVQVARHPDRPFTLDYVHLLFDEFEELHGDRKFGDDAAIVGGVGLFRGRRIMLLGHQKGRTTQENVSRNFGMPRPEGYRKALRLMQVADRFKLPVVTFIDTMGAFPGIEAEERGQSQAIAEAIEGMAALRVPVISIVIGEGGSGGALAIGVGNCVMMLENAIYSVISPEGCASILFKDAAHAPKAADALRLTARDLMMLGVVDEAIPEPLGGAHRDHVASAKQLGNALEDQLTRLAALDAEALVDQRYDRFRKLGEITKLIGSKELEAS
ncbi:MAG: acetyl-CoA carboxylase carboxyltransferase subunit alpha [Myxococcales bacterium]|nr:acetyl-CoA carboxylase carboxyltransferase subunit alpha [Myxococcales bacterium]